MHNSLLDWSDKLLLRKRAIIETITDQLKNISQIEHSRHRSPINFLVNLVAGLDRLLSSAEKAFAWGATSHSARGLTYPELTLY
jgi:hypothetical protein